MSTTAIEPTWRQTELSVSSQGDVAALEQNLKFPPQSYLEAKAEWDALYEDAQEEARQKNPDYWPPRPPLRVERVKLRHLGLCGSMAGVLKVMDICAAAGARLFVDDIPISEHRWLVEPLAELDRLAWAARSKAIGHARAQAVLAKHEAQQNFTRWTAEYAARHDLVSRIASGITAEPTNGEAHIGADFRAWREGQGLSRVAVAERLTTITGEPVTEAKVFRFEAGARSTLPVEAVYELQYPHTEEAPNGAVHA